MTDDTPKTIKFRTLRPVRIASLSGHIINIKPGHPVDVPPPAQAEAYAMGCVPVDSDNGDHKAPLVPQGDDRERAIMDSIHILITKGDLSKFKVNGIPRVDAVEEEFGYAVTSIEVETMFNKIERVSEDLSRLEEMNDVVELANSDNEKE